MRSTLLKMGLFALVGGILGFVLLNVVSLFAAGGHGTSLPFIALFPWNEIVFRVNPIAPDWLLSVIGLLQMPLYALVIGAASEKGQRLLGLGMLLVLHCSAFGVCFLPQSFFDSL